MMPFIKSTMPYFLMIGLLVLTLCTKEEKLTSEEIEQIQTVDSLTTELEVEFEKAATTSKEAEESIDELLEDI